MAERTKLCFVIDDLERCGSTMLLHAWLGSTQLHQRQRCHVVSLGPAGDMGIELQSAGAAVHALDCSASPSSIRGGLLALLRLHSYLQQLRPECVHAVGAAASFVGPAAARLARVPQVVVTPRGAARTAPLLRLLLGGALRSADVVTAVNAAEAQRLSALLGVHSERLRVVPPAIAPHRCAQHSELPALAGQPRVVMLGRFRDGDDIDWIAQSLKLLVSQHPSLVLSAFGTGTAGRRLQHAAQRLELGAHLQVLGPSDDPAGVLLAADVFLNPHRSEHAPLALLEAMALGTPVVSVAGPGLEGFGESGVHALLVPGGNPALIADAIDRVLMDREVRESLRWNAKELVARECAAPPAVAALAEIYSEGSALEASFAV